MSKLIIFAHGIGDAPKGFEQEWINAIDWQTIIGKKFEDQSEVIAKGLRWEDVLDEVEKQYPLLNTDLLAKIGFTAFNSWVDNHVWNMFNDYFMDVLVYTALDEMWVYIQDECVKKLNKIVVDNNVSKADTILIGHSLGAAMFPHLVWRECVDNGAIPYRGMILLASPLGFESPDQNLCKDFLTRMGEISSETRAEVVRNFSKMWRMSGENRLRFIANKNDIVCSNITFTVSPGVSYKLPMNMSFNNAEIASMNAPNAGCFQPISFGKPEPTQIVENHNPLKYMKDQTFIDALKAMLS